MMPSTQDPISTPPTTTPEAAARLLDERDEHCHCLSDYIAEFPEIDFDTRPTSRVNHCAGFVLSGGLGVIYPTKDDGWAGIASPQRIDDPEAWRTLFETLASRINVTKWRNFLRNALFIDEYRFGGAMGWDELHDDDWPDHLSGSRVVYTTLYDRGHGVRYIPRAWLAHHGIIRPVVLPEDFPASPIPVAVADTSARVERTVGEAETASGSEGYDDLFDLPI